MTNDRIVPTEVNWESSDIDRLCPFCPFLEANTYGDWDPDPLKRNLLFHRGHSGFQDEGGVRSLCVFCQHLDPGQLFGHLGQGNTDRLYSGYAGIRISFGTLAEVEARGPCVFCHIVMCTIRAHAAIYRTKDVPTSEHQPITIDSWGHLNSSIKLSFDNGPKVCMAIKKVWPAQLDSIPQVNQVLGPWISWEPIRQWIDSCSIKHTECLSTVTAPSGMRLIDVRARKVTPELDPYDRHAFVALSYVWGKNIDSRTCALLKENTAQLEQTNGLKDLPKTIEDAMTICKNLGQRFLWVDRLCIVQNDKAKRGHQIHAMADIFQSALLTIVATCGDGIESPIPGVSTERQTFQSQTRIAGLQVMSALPQLSRSLPEAPWSKRGWTYQESILSSRKLFFTNLEVWFACNDGLKREDVSVEDSDLDVPVRENHHHAPSTQLHGQNPDFAFQAMDDYWTHLEEYTKRSLTLKSDIYNAFTGILTALFGEGKTVYGLPELYFDKALLWRLGRETSTCCIRDCTADKQQLLCPSWAWSSIDGAVRSGDEIDFGTFIVSLVLWSFVDEGGNIKNLNVKFEKFYPYMEEDPYSLASLMFAWGGGCFEAALPSNLRKMLDLDSHSLHQWVECDLSQRWPTRREFLIEVRSQGSPGPEVLSTTFNHLRPGMLLTKTQTAVLRLENCDRSPDSKYFYIRNEYGSLVGAVEANELCLKLKAKGTQKLETTIYELMALSLSCVPSDEENDFFDRNGDRVLGNVAVKVLLISWDKNVPIARRVSIGWVYLKAWVETERTWKTVVLQ